ncbi:helix-turn-helix domain-containing protein [Vibrio algarum]|uniref:Helix-turn-helix transcriptional regulator n=1 Tax=Vibrio algarum TaxID=3020714 RepID=A0ABT4YX29_9VIBR|nr:helix-turn-helix transcriptional regulator [Vibrio sp. KJ40-1]MDB1126143.1 helix-turn-helix transcriptional regulator [Vibrio sp. KJ40-1]
MKVVDFGKVIKRLRTLESITQSELVSLIDAATGGETGVDTVSVSRWENNIITPSHRRQVEIVNSLGYELSELIEPDVISVCQQDLEMALNSRIIDAKYWDFTSTPCKKDNIEKKACEWRAHLL